MLQFVLNTQQVEDVPSYILFHLLGLGLRAVPKFPLEGGDSKLSAFSNGTGPSARYPRSQSTAESLGASWQDSLRWGSPARRGSPQSGRHNGHHGSPRQPRPSSRWCGRSLLWWPARSPSGSGPHQPSSAASPQPLADPLSTRT